MNLKMIVEQLVKQYKRINSKRVNSKRVNSKRVNSNRGGDVHV